MSSIYLKALELASGNVGYYGKIVGKSATSFAVMNFVVEEMFPRSPWTGLEYHSIPIVLASTFLCQKAWDIVPYFKGQFHFVTGSIGWVIIGIPLGNTVSKIVMYLAICGIHNYVLRDVNNRMSVSLTKDRCDPNLFTHVTMITTSIALGVFGCHFITANLISSVAAEAATILSRKYIFKNDN